MTRSLSKVALCLVAATAFSSACSSTSAAPGHGATADAGASIPADCVSYLACIQSDQPAAYSAAKMQYGPEGACWSKPADERAACQKVCAEGVKTLGRCCTTAAQCPEVTPICDNARGASSTYKCAMCLGNEDCSPGAKCNADKLCELPDAGTD